MINKICEYCKKEFKVDDSKRGHWIIKYCSNYCHGKARRSKPGYKEKIKTLQKDWEIKNKEHRLEYCRKWEHKNLTKRVEKNRKWIKKKLLENPNLYRDYHDKYKERELVYRKSKKGKEVMKKAKDKFNKIHPNYMKEFFESNKELCRKYSKKYCNSSKGKAKRLYQQEKRRYKFGAWKDKVSAELIKLVNERDKVCVYCHREFESVNPNHNPRYPTYDHLNCHFPFSNINIVKCCSECNSSKNSTNVLEWCIKKAYKPSEIVFELLNKQEIESH